MTRTCTEKPLKPAPKAGAGKAPPKVTKNQSGPLEKACKDLVSQEMSMTHEIKSVTEKMDSKPKDFVWAKEYRALYDATIDGCAHAELAMGITEFAAGLRANVLIAANFSKFKKQYESAVWITNLSNFQSVITPVLEDRKKSIALLVAGMGALNKSAPTFALEPCKKKARKSSKTGK